MVAWGVWQKAKPVRKPLRPTCPGPGQMTAEQWANASAGGLLWSSCAEREHQEALEASREHGLGDCKCVQMS